MRKPATPWEVIAFVMCILQLKDEFAISCTGWGRTPARNKAVGGLPESWHLDWLAVDIVRDRGVDKAKLLARITAMGLQYEDESDHIHIERG